jgi:hypothetical protein
MSASNMMRAAAIVIAATITGAVAPPAWGASDRSGKFSTQNWPEETIYKPDCRTVQADGTWLACRGSLEQ